MLAHLTIKNYALIRHLEIKPSGHLNVITGETGAGKSIMLGAIALLLGNRADTKVLWDESEKCVIEGIFDIGSLHLQKLFESFDLDFQTQSVIRREIGVNGKSRAFINDTPVTLEIMKTIGSRLMDVHSQHETLELGSRKFQLHLIDTFAGNEKLRTDYAASWQEYQRTRKEHDALLSESLALKEEADFVRFQLDELVKAELIEDEQEKAETRLKIMEHAEDIKSRFNQVLQLLSGQEFAVSSSLAEVRALLNPVMTFSETYRQLFQRIESVRIELDDVLAELESEEQKIEFDPVQTEALKERLSLLYHLMQKHRTNDVAALLAVQETLQLRADKTSNVDALLAAAKNALDNATASLHQKASALSTSRAKIFVGLSKHMVTLLQDLGIPEVKLDIVNETVAPGPSGTDSVDILFSANKGIAARPLAQVASGGEFSRLMFCVKYVLAEKTSLPTLVLDEIDSGISGEIAMQLGDMMKTMAAKHQLITITHLPQIAAKGDTHYYVYKDNSSAKTTTHIRQLNEEERVAEIAKMIGGARPSALAMENARELMTPKLG